MEGNEEHYIPTPEDVYAVRRGLRRRVPPEIAILIVEAAQYWPKVTWQAAATARSGTGHWIFSQIDGPQCCLVTPPLSQWTGLREGSFKPRDIRFKITSHDQGWTTDNVQGYTSECQPTFAPKSFSISWIQHSIWDLGRGLKRPLSVTSDSMKGRKIII